MDNSILGGADGIALATRDKIDYIVKMWPCKQLFLAWSKKFSSSSKSGSTKYSGILKSSSSQEYPNYHYDNYKGHIEVVKH